jgi:acetylornithine deacetylase
MYIKIKINSFNFHLGGLSMENLSVKELAAKLVGFKTVSTGENHCSVVEMAEWITNYLRPLGFTVKLFDYENHGKKNVNLLASIGGDTMPKLAFAGHMDTVGAGKWSGSDSNPNIPWELQLKDDRYYGLGIADMKCFLAIAIKAAEIISTEKLIHPFTLCFTGDEEVGCLGAKKLAEKIKKISDYVVIGEPTSNTPIYMHKGYMYLGINVGIKNSTGKDNPVHASNPTTSTNVIERVLPIVIGELSNIKSRLETICDERFKPFYPYPSMNIGGEFSIGRNDKEKTKQSKNIIPLGFYMSCEIRPLSGQDTNSLRALVRRVLNEALSNIKCQKPNESIELKVDFVRAPTLPMETPIASPIIKASSEISGKNPEAVVFNTEGGIFNRGGSETVIWGPSDISQAHVNNESVPQKILDDPFYVDQYLKLIRQFCCEGGKYV